jgi:hypothetical protein
VFIWARPTFFLPGPAHGRPVQAAASPPSTPADRPVLPVSAPLLTPSPAARRAPLVSGTAAPHCCHGPPVSLSPPFLFGWQRAHGARRAHPPVLCRCRPGAARRSAGTPLLVPRFLHASVTSPDPPSDSSSRRPPLKRAPHHDYLLSALTSRRSHLPHLRREPPGRPAAHRSPLVPAAGFRLCGVSPASTPPAWRHPGAPPVVVGSTMPSASPHRAAVERDTATACALFPRVASRLFGWAAPPGRGPAVFPAGRAWQAAGPSVAGRGPV